MNLENIDGHDLIAKNVNSQTSPIFCRYHYQLTRKTTIGHQIFKTVNRHRYRPFRRSGDFPFHLSFRSGVILKVGYSLKC